MKETTWQVRKVRAQDDSWISDHHRQSRRMTLSVREDDKIAVVLGSRHDLVLGFSKTIALDSHFHSSYRGRHSEA